MTASTPVAVEISPRSLVASCTSGNGVITAQHQLKTSVYSSSQTTSNGSSGQRSTRDTYSVVHPKTMPNATTMLDHDAHKRNLLSENETPRLHPQPASPKKTAIPPAVVKGPRPAELKANGRRSEYSTTASKAPLPRGKITSSVPSSRFVLGPFSVSWDADADDGATLSISHRNDPDHIVWRSLPGESFVAASVVNMVVTERRASFQVKEEVNRTAFEQTVDAIKQSGDSLVISGKVSDGPGGDESIPATYRLRFTKKSDGDLEFDLQVTDEDSLINEVFLRYSSSSNERIYGLGEQFTHVNLKGHEVPVLCQEGGIGRGRPSISKAVRILSPGSEGHAYSTYVAVPHYLTSQRRSVFLEDSNYSVFDFRSGDSICIRVTAPTMKGHILHGKSLLKLIERYTEHCGRMPPLPDWLNKGAVVGLQGGSERVRRVYEQLREYDVPVSALWLQDWVGRRTTKVGQQLWWNWQLDTAKYPDWQDLVAELQQSDTAVMGYINPMLVQGAPIGEGQRDLYEEARERGFLVRDQKDRIYDVTATDFNAGLIDLTNPKARKWIKDIIKTELIGNGMKGWMADFGEGLPFDAKLYSGQDAAAYHNRYPEEWAKVNREAIREAGKEGDVIFFTRSGFTNSPKHSTLFWEGDQNVTWDGDDGLKSAIKGLFSGFSGFALNHSDIGGYTCLKKLGLGFVRDTELLLRWMEADAFTAVFRTHEGLTPEINQQVYSDDTTLTAFARFAKVYAALAPYRKKLMQEAEQKGHPVVRHLILNYPDDENVYDLEYQYMLGTEYLVAPVTDAKQRTVRAYLPAGRWVHLWTGQEFGSTEQGSWQDVPAPLGQPPVFYPRNSEEGARLTAELRRVGVLE